MGSVIYIQRQSSGVYLPEYGLLYNYWAATDARNLAAADWSVPTAANWTTLVNTIGGGNYGYKLKETGLTYWDSPNTDATNEVAFNARGGGQRTQTTGAFQYIKIQTWFASSSLYFADWDVNKLAYNLATIQYNFTTQKKDTGAYMRLLYTGSGTPTEYVGNDLKKYRIIQIGSQFWLADNLCETRFRNNDIIPWHGADPANYFTNAEWAALTTPGCAAYGNTLSNVATGFTFPT